MRRAQPQPYTYRHAVLPQKQFAAARISLTFRSPDLSANGPWAPRRLDPRVYQPEFLSSEEAQALLEASSALPRKRGLVRPWGQPRGHVMGQSFLDVPSKRVKYVSPDLLPKPISQAPTPIRRMMSLITLPSEYNDSHEHAVLKDKEQKGIRYGWNCKCVDEIYHALNSQAPKVWDCHAGKKYPKDAIYVGCRVRNRKGGVIREPGHSTEGLAHSPAQLHDAAQAEREQSQGCPGPAEACVV